MTEVAGTLEVLNVYAGDVTVTMSSMEELEKAMDMVEDMLKKGFAVLLRLENGSHRRVTGVDRKTASYEFTEPVTEEAAPVDGEPTPKPVKRGRRAKAPMKKTHAVAVGRSAGG